MFLKYLGEVTTMAPTGGFILYHMKFAICTHLMENLLVSAVKKLPCVVPLHAMLLAGPNYHSVHFKM